MSLFLGKIHYALYEKIKVHEEIYNRIINFAVDQDLDVREIVEYEYNMYGSPISGVLENDIDAGNIHGSLQKLIDSVEYRTAHFINALLQNGIDYKHIEKIYEMLGEELSSYIEYNNNDMKTIYTSVYELILEGMPCDGVNRLIAVDEDSVEWFITKNIHEKYWVETGGTADVQMRLYNAFISSFVKKIDAGLSFEQDETGRSKVWR